MEKFCYARAHCANSQFLVMSLFNEAFAQALFNALPEELDSQNISWPNAIGYTSDSASVMVGKNNSLWR